MRRIATFAFIALSTVLAAAPARAVTYVFDDITSVTRSNNVSIGNDAYASFSTGSAGAAMSSLELTLGKSASTSTGTITVGLYSQASTGVVGVLLATLGTVTVNSLSTTYGVVTVTSSANYLLAASTRYFIGLIDSGTNGRWGTSAPATGTASEYHGTASAPSAETLNTTVAYMMRVAVPEPASMAVLGSGIAGLLMARRRKSRS